MASGNGKSRKDRDGFSRVFGDVAKLRTGWRELRVSPGLVLPQPAIGEGMVEPGDVLLRRAAFLEQERPVDPLEVDAAILQRLGGVGDAMDGSANGPAPRRPGEVVIGL